MELQKKEPNHTVKHNIRMYYGFSTFSNLLILGPILTLFYLEKGLNFYPNHGDKRHLRNWYRYF